MITSSFFVTAFSTAGFASILTSFLRIASLASTFVTSASEVTWVNSFLASLTSSVCFSSDFAFSSSFLASSFSAVTFAFDSTTVEFNALSAATFASTSSWVASAFANTAFAFTNSSRAAFTTASSAFLTDDNFCSKLSILALRAVLSAAFVSTFVASSAFGVSAPTLAATSAATLSLVFSTFVGCVAALGASSFVTLVSVFVVFFVVVLSDTCSLACATVPIPKKILAPITTDAAPTLNFLIE